MFNIQRPLFIWLLIKADRREPRVIATAVSDALYNDTFVITIRSVSPAAFAANVYRVDQSLATQDDGWQQLLRVSYVAWEDGADSPAGTVWGSWSVLPTSAAIPEVRARRNATPGDFWTCPQ